MSKLKSETISSSAQARGRRLVNPLFLTIAAVFLLLFIVLIIANDPKPIANTNVSAPSPAANTMDEVDSAKWRALLGVSDCQLALSVYNNYQPIFAELHQYVTKAPPPTYEELYNWKKLTRIDKRIEELDDKYPQTYPISMINRQFAKGLSFAIGQYWRNTYSSMRLTNNQGPIDSEQPSLMNDDCSCSNRTAQKNLKK